MTAQTPRTKRTHWPHRAFRTAAVLVTALALTACGGGGSDDGGKSTQTPSATWGKWATVPFAASAVASVGDRTLLLNEDDHTLAVYDSEGKKKWRVPGGVGRDDKPRVVAGAKALFITAKDGIIRALNWEDGKQLWSFDAGSVSKCIGASSLGLASSSGSVYLGQDDHLMMTVSRTTADQQQYGYDAAKEIPAQCTKSTTSMPTVPSLVALDPATGKAAWKGSATSLNNEVYPARIDPSGKYVFQVNSHRGFPDVSRTEVATGKTVTSGPLPLTDNGYTIGDSISSVPYSADGFTLEWGGADVATGGTKYDAKVTKWLSAAQAGGSSTATSGQPSLPKLSGDDTCKYRTRTSQPTPGLASVGYCFAMTQPGKLQVSAVSGDGPEHVWTINGDKAVNDWGGQNTYGDNPIVSNVSGTHFTAMADGQGQDASSGESASGDAVQPFIAVATPGGSLSAFELASGKKAWTWSPGDSQTADASAGPSGSSGSSGGSGDDTGADPGGDSGMGASALFPDYVSSTGQVVVARGGSVFAVDAASGQQVWEKKVSDTGYNGNGDGPQLGNMTATGSSVAVQVGGERTTTYLRSAS